MKILQNILNFGNLLIVLIIDIGLLIVWATLYLLDSNKDKRDRDKQL